MPDPDSPAWSETLELPADLDLNPDFRAVLDFVEGEPGCLFVTGKAGTGKSTLLRYLKARLRGRAVVLAPTGVAAVNVGGQTIHSFFKFPARLLTPALVRELRAWGVHRRADLIIVDEVSMVRADVMDAMDLFLRAARQCPLPFGGARLLFFGDLHQLPPVVAPGEAEAFASLYESPWFFRSHVFGRLPCRAIGLGRVYRQKDADFLALLNGMRRGDLEPEDLEALNRRCGDGEPDGDAREAGEAPAVHLCATNSAADLLNFRRLSALPGEARAFPAKVEGDFDRRHFPAEEPLRLKIGAQVMFLRNDPQGRWVNGSLGKVAGFAEDEVLVELARADRPVLPVGRVAWENLRYEADPATGAPRPVTAGVLRQFPLRLAWAITIHKSQGKTFERVVIDLGQGAFAHGQAYVAFSRCTTLAGIRLRRPLRARDLCLDPEVAEYLALAGI